MPQTFAYTSRPASHRPLSSDFSTSWWPYVSFSSTTFCCEICLCWSFYDGSVVFITFYDFSWAFVALRSLRHRRDQHHHLSLNLLLPFDSYGFRNSNRSSIQKVEYILLKYNLPLIIITRIFSRTVLNLNLMRCLL